MLDFIRMPDNEELTERHHFIDYEVGKYRVIFGYRLRAGSINCMSYDLDICCGAQKKDYDDMFMKIKSIMKWNHNRGEWVFQDIPSMSMIKPYMNDDQFLDVIEDLYERSLGNKK